MREKRGIRTVTRNGGILSEKEDGCRSGEGEFVVELLMKERKETKMERES